MLRSSLLFLFLEDINKSLQPLFFMDNVFTESTRQRAYCLVAQAYTSITAEDFASFVGYSVEEAVKGENSNEEDFYL